jgi:hypothetical protein
MKETDLTFILDVHQLLLKQQVFCLRFLSSHHSSVGRLLRHHMRRHELSVLSGVGVGDLGPVELRVRVVKVPLALVCHGLVELVGVDVVHSQAVQVEVLVELGVQLALHLLHHLVHRRVLLPVLHLVLQLVRDHLTADLELVHRFLELVHRRGHHLQVYVLGLVDEDGVDALDFLHELRRY